MRNPAVRGALITISVLAVLGLGWGCGGGDDDPGDGTTDGRDTVGETDGSGEGSDSEPGDEGGEVAPVDNDGDTYPEDVDCDDDDEDVHPGADETCNGTDDDCDLQTDEDATDASTWYADDDSDSYGDSEVTLQACAAPDDYVGNDDDCDDAVADINPEATEACDSVDNDCDEAVDEEDATGCTEYALDADDDNFGDPEEAHCFCARPAGYVVDATDCDDDNSSVHPGAAEVCNGIDDDCDPATEEDSSSAAATWYHDEDGDTFGDPSDTRLGCERPVDYVANGDDCEDRPTAGGLGIYPGAVDRPDPMGVDANCDGIDGDETCSVFLSVNTGTDSNTGLDRDHPVQTLPRAMAVAAGLPDCDPADADAPHPVLVAEGTYHHLTTLALVAGVGLYGGYNDGLPNPPATTEIAWDRDRAVGETLITSNATPAVRADALTRDTELERIRIVGTNVSGPGQETVVLLVTATPTENRLILRSCEIRRGTAGNGTAGGPGTFIPCTAYTGGTGGALDGCASDAGLVGNHGARTWDGAGGAGGTAGASSCPDWDENHCPLTASVGAGGTGGTGANGGAPPQAESCESTGGAVGSFNSTTFDWTPCTGGLGGQGGHGGGGGGGGEGGGQYYDGACSGACTGTGCWSGRSNDGGNGGQGGAGGCGGGGGLGGMGGGSSFGVVLFRSRVEFISTSISGGQGGAGGRGGDGANGTNGASTGVPGSAGTDCCNLLRGVCEAQCPGGGGNGGPGGNGARGGGGSGGNGGSVVGIAVHTPVTGYTPAASYVDGTFGTGGGGGAGSVAGLPGVNGRNIAVQNY